MEIQKEVKVESQSGRQLEIAGGMGTC